MLEPGNQTRRFAFEFNGNARDYFGIWIVNLVLTILTLGIYSAWAKVRTNRYFYGNTRVAGSGFDYTADPKKILLGRAIAVTMLLVYQVLLFFMPAAGITVLVLFGLAIPFVYLSSIAFRMRYSQWRNIHFGFQRDVGKAYLLLLPLILYVILLISAPLLFGIDLNELDVEEDGADLSQRLQQFLTFNSLMVLVGMLAFPLWQRFYYKFIGDRVRFGRSSFAISLHAGSFYLMYFLALLLVVGLSLLYFFAVVLVLPTSSDVPQGSLFAAIVFTYLTALLPYIVVFAFIKTYLTNLLYNNLRTDNVAFECTLKFGRMAWIYLTNTLAILVTLGLAVPWSKIRLARYRAAHMQMLVDGELDVVAADRGELSASGDAMTDLFDLDIGL